MVWWPNFNLAKDKYKRLLNNLRTPEYMMRMNTHELKSLDNMYDTDNNIVEVVYTFWYMKVNLI